MSLQGSIIKLENGEFGFESKSTDFNRPQMIRHVWPMVHCRVTGFRGADPAEAIGKPATCADGHINCYLGQGAHFGGVLPQGGSTKATILEVTDIPRPKIRPGIETRWHNGGWQKLLRKGWVPCA